MVARQDMRLSVRCWTAGLTAAVLCAAAPLCLGGLPGSKHDFSGRSWMPDGQICVICHGPHNGAAPLGTGLLWNHTETSAVYQIYRSDTLRASAGQPDGSSRLCLSCHDGTARLDSFGGQAGSEFCGRIIGTDLRSVHPISFVYDDALAASVAHLKSPSAASGFGGTIASDLLRGGKMQCSSCHEPHNRYPNEGRFLRKRDRNGTQGLCGVCHTSKPPGSLAMGRWE